MLQEDQAANAVTRLKTLFRICSELKRAYAISRTEIDKNKNVNSWRIPNISLFSRLDEFINRLSGVCNISFYLRYT
jgi:hypothetical protein